MKHQPAPYRFLGTSMRQAKNGKHYRVLHLVCPVCGRRTNPIANAWRSGRCWGVSGGS
jgi:hypothetical protein